ncbi:hypothetical protein [Pseudomonas protegens]
MLKSLADKKPAQWRARLGIAVFSPADPDSAAFKMFDAHTAGFTDLLNYSLPCLRALVVISSDSHYLDFLHSWRSYKALNAATDKLIGVSRLCNWKSGSGHL